MRKPAFAFAIPFALLPVLAGLGGCSSDPAVVQTDDEPLDEIRPFDHCDPGGPCPDLALDKTTLAHSIIIETRDVDPHSCSVDEGTILAGGRRRLLRFTTATTNIGTGDLFLGE